MAQAITQSYLVCSMKLLADFQSVHFHSVRVLQDSPYGNFRRGHSNYHAEERQHTRNMCAHRLDAVMATASEKFIDRFAAVLEEDRFAAVLESYGFTPVAEAFVTSGNELLAALSGWSMDKALGMPSS